MHFEHQRHKKQPLTPPDWLETVHETDKLRYIRVRGKLTSAQVEQAEEYMQETMGEDAEIKRNLLIDFRDVDTIDTAVIAYLVKRLREYKHKGFRLGLVGLKDEPIRMMEIVHVESWFNIYDNVDAALADLASSEPHA